MRPWSSSRSPPSPPAAAETISRSSSAGNATDAAFITDMTAHHEGAIEMARIAQKHAEHPEIRRLAADIVAAQGSEISVMKTIRRDMDHMREHTTATWA